MRKKINFFKGEKSQTLKGKWDNLFISAFIDFGKVNIEVEDKDGKLLFNQTLSNDVFSDNKIEIFNIKVPSEVNVKIKSKNHKGEISMSYREINKFSKESKEGIFLYGETHNYEGIKKVEADLWGKYYNEYGMRNLFIEDSYIDAQFLNMWMKSDNDKILNQLYDDCDGSVAHSEENLNFYKEIKEKYPETIFYGTDVCHSYEKTGERYLKYLEENGKVGTDDYNRAVNSVNQGKKFYENNNPDNTYRENMLVKNFINEYEKLDDKRVMGIYGKAHLLPYSKASFGEIPYMVNQLDKKYPKILNIEDACTLEKYPKYKDSEYRYYK